MVLEEFNNPMYAEIDKNVFLEYNLHGNPKASEKVVLIMGLLSTREGWDLTLQEIMRQAHGQYEILTFDNRGIGGSSSPKERYSTKRMARDTCLLMNHLGWMRAHIVGISMGGMIALQLAARVPTRVLSLSLLVTSAGFPHHLVPRLNQVNGFKAILETSVDKSTERIIQKLLFVLYSDQFLETIVDEASGKTNRDILYLHHKSRLRRGKRPNIYGAVGQIAAAITHHVSAAALERIKDAGFPILIFSAQHDRLVHPQNSRVLYDYLKSNHTKFVEVPAGHGVVNETTDGLVFHLLRTFDNAKQVNFVGPSICVTDVSRL